MPERAGPAQHVGMVRACCWCGQVLQLYAAQALSSGGGDAQAEQDGGGAGEDVVQQLLAADEERWDALLHEAVASEVRFDAACG